MIPLVPPRNILHVTHPWGGGIQTYLDDMVRMFGERSNILLLISEQGVLQVLNAVTGVKSSYRFGAPIRLTDYHRPDYRELVEDVLDYFDIDLVHFNSMVGHTYDLIEVAHGKNIPIVYTVHDYYFICPTFHMVKSDGSFCEGCDSRYIDVDCLLKNDYLSYSGYDADKLTAWRDEFRDAMPCIDAFIFPSEAARDQFEKFYPIARGKAAVIMHGDSIKGAEGGDGSIGSELRVGVIGSLWKHKGRDLVEYIVENNADRGITFFHFGDQSIPSAKITKLGRYEQNQIVSLLKQHRIDLLLILSTWPETFSYTLSEAIKAEIPAIVTNLGATRERVDNLGIGWIVDYRQPQQVLDLLGHLKENRQEIETKKAALGQMEKQDLESMKRHYDEVYNKVSSARGPHLKSCNRLVLGVKLAWRQLKSRFQSATVVR